MISVLTGWDLEEKYNFNNYIIKSIHTMVYEPPPVRVETETGAGTETVLNKCDRTPPALNLKCIFFTLLLSIGYWFLPERNKWVLLGLLYFPYIVLAYYDHFYRCDRNMGPTYLAMFYAPFKPRTSRQIVVFNNWCRDIKLRVYVIDILVLFLIIAGSKTFLKWEPIRKVLKP